MPKMIVQINGADVEVDVPAGFVSEDSVKEQYMPKAVFEDEIKRRTSSVAQNTAADTRKKLLDDDTFKEEAAKKWGLGKTVDPNDVARTAQEAVKKSREEWQLTELEPERKEKARLAQQNGRLMTSRLQGEIVGAAIDGGVKKAMCRPIVTGQPAAIVSMLQSVFGYDEERDAFLVRNGDGWAFATHPTQGNPYKTVTEFVKEWAASKDNADFLEDVKQRGASMGQPGGNKPGVSGGKMEISYTDAQNMRKYMAAQAEAVKLGVELVIGPKA